MESRINSIVTTLIVTLTAFWFTNANAADKPETLTGTIIVGAAGYGIRLESGRIIGFMGRGGNKVFATCHNDDRCEITGIILHNTRKPLFLSVITVRKLAGAAPTPKVRSEAQTASTATAPDNAQTPANNSDGSPFLLDDSDHQQDNKPVPAPAKQ
ncbi:MAG: hypothetical protein P8Z72_06040 [Gammaproteobacteria bacterium]